MAMIGTNLRYGGETEAAVIFVLGGLGLVANIALMTLIFAKKQLRRMLEPTFSAQVILLQIPYLTEKPVKPSSQLIAFSDANRI
ncbi:hypothetical protein J6590_071629 [Homalodisca vitripennis]|nr:hypothetical protein J6590_071629 [Homalodisca vitripennis]